MRETDTMGESSSATVETGVDRLLALLKQHKKLSLSGAAKALHVSQPVVQSWVDFLIEEGIVGLEYKFITPYIYLNTDSVHKKVAKDSKDTLQLKQEFYAKAQERKLPTERTNLLWRQYVAENLMTIKSEFEQAATHRGVPQKQLEALWLRYKQQLLTSQ